MGQPAGTTDAIDRSVGARPRRYARRAVALGVVVALPLTLLCLAALLGVVSGPLRLVALPVGLAPLIVGIVLARTPGTPQRRGFGLGLALGWVLWLVVVGGTLLVGLLLILSHMFTFEVNGVSWQG